ncbi:MAG: hypothetical protein ACKO71_07000, partial [Betaproteobacteria bacterium]
LTAIASVIPHTSLTALSANNNGITDKAMGAEGLTHLQELYLKYNLITDKGALSFAQNLDDRSCRLSWICLQGNEVTKKGGQIIKLCLPETIPGGSIVDY